MLHAQLKKGLIFLVLSSAMWSLKVCWSSKVTPRFLTDLAGVIDDKPSWMVKLCCRVGLAGKTRLFFRIHIWLFVEHMSCVSVFNKQVGASSEQLPQSAAFEELLEVVACRA